MHAGALATSLGQVLTNQSVGVLVGSSLPRMMRIGEVEAHAGLSLDALVVMEFRSIVRRDGLDATSMLADELAATPLPR